MRDVRRKAAHRRIRRSRAAAALLGAALIVAACSADDPDGDGTPASDAAPASTTTSTATSTSAGESRFCALLAETTGEVEESYLGSPQHRAQIEQLAAAAPDEVRPDVERFSDHVHEFVDPAIPGSADVERYPADVKAAVGRITAFQQQRC